MQTFVFRDHYTDRVTSVFFKFTDAETGKQMTVEMPVSEWKQIIQHLEPV